MATDHPESLGLPTRLPRRARYRQSARRHEPFPEAARRELRQHPDCAATSGTPPTRSAPSARGGRRGARTGRSCATPGSALKTDVMARLPELLEQLEAQRGGPRRGGALGARRRRGQPDRHRTDPGHRRRRGGQGQVDGHPGDRAQRAPGGRGHRGDRDRPGRADRPARPRQAQSTSWCRRSTATAPRSARSSCARCRDAGELTDEPRVLAMAARAHLRRKFLSAKVAVSGANFGVAETGTLAVVESEGNGRMCLTLPQTLITVMGIEKVVPAVQRSRGVPAAAAALVDRRADEPVHLDVDRRAPRRRAAGVPPGAAGQRPHRACSPTRSAAPRCTASAAAPASTSARCTSAPAGTPTARSIPGPIGAILSPAADRDARPRRPERLAAVRLVAVRRVLRRLPGTHRHPVDPGAPARRAGRRPGTGPGARIMAMRAAAWAMASPTRFAAAEKAPAGRPVRRRRRPPDHRAALAGVALDREPRHPRPAAGDVPPVVGHAPTARRPDD